MICSSPKMEQLLSTVAGEVISEVPLVEGGGGGYTTAHSNSGCLCHVGNSW